MKKLYPVLISNLGTVQDVLTYPCQIIGPLVRTLFCSSYGKFPFVTPIGDS